MTDTPDGEEPPVLNVVRPVFGAQTTRTERKGWCLHRSIELDGHLRQVSCQSCNAILDAFDVLDEYARKERSFQDWDRQSRAKIQELEELRAEEKKIKARTQAASRKDATEAVRRERERTLSIRRKLHAKAVEIARAAEQIGRLALLKEEEEKTG